MNVIKYNKVRTAHKVETINLKSLNKAVEFIKSGNIVAFPTETVYGLGADASNEDACQKIFKLKGRPSNNPLIVHVLNLEQAKTIGEFNEEAIKLANMFWPGPLSIVVPIKNNAKIARSVLAGLTTIALRSPSSYIARELIKNSQGAIAAPSANPSGYISATTAEHARQHFLNEPEVFILQDSLNKSQYGLESTIIDTASPNLTILREGFITKEALEEAVLQKINTLATGKQIKAPGMMLKHYAPQVNLRINASDLQLDEIGLNFADSKLSSNFSRNLSRRGDLIEAAANLYFNLRLLDTYAGHKKISTIAVARIPQVGVGVAINDRLKRAAQII